MSKRNQWCKHYRGMHMKTTCEAGVAFASLPHYATRDFHRTCPCFSDNLEGECEKKEYPTAEEVAAEETEMEARFAAMVKARAAIVEDCGGPWKRGKPPEAGTINCPACGAEDSLRYSRAGYNGHIHAGCKTEGCVRWME